MVTKNGVTQRRPYTNDNDSTNGNSHGNSNGNTNGHHTNGHGHDTNGTTNGHHTNGHNTNGSSKVLSPVDKHDRLWKWQNIVRILFVIPLLGSAIWLLSKSNADARQAIKLLDPKLGVEIHEKSYDDECGWKDIRSKIEDPFVFAHFFGWMANAMVSRASGLTICMSLVDELCELWWRSAYNNFKECWWDHIFLDIIICNSGGALIGAYIMKRFFNQSRDYWTEFAKDPHNRRGRYLINLLAVKVVTLFTLFGFKGVLWIPPAHFINYFRCFAYCACLEGAMSDAWNAVRSGRRGIRAHSQLLLLWLITFFDLALVCKMGYHEPLWNDMSDMGKALFGMGTAVALYSFTVVL